MLYVFICLKRVGYMWCRWDPKWGGRLQTPIKSKFKKIKFCRHACMKHLT
jgi:hypothetical protein